MEQADVGEGWSDPASAPVHVCIEGDTFSGEGGAIGAATHTHTHMIVSYQCPLYRDRRHPDAATPSTNHPVCLYTCLGRWRLGCQHRFAYLTIEDVSFSNYFMRLFLCRRTPWAQLLSHSALWPWRGPHTAWCEAALGTSVAAVRRPRQLRA